MVCTPEVNNPVCLFAPYHAEVDVKEYDCFAVALSRAINIFLSPNGSPRRMLYLPLSGASHINQAISTGSYSAGTCISEHGSHVSDGGSDCQPVLFGREITP